MVRGVIHTAASMLIDRKIEEFDEKWQEVEKKIQTVMDEMQDMRQLIDKHRDMLQPTSDSSTGSPLFIRLSSPTEGIFEFRSVQEVLYFWSKPRGKLFSCQVYIERKVDAESFEMIFGQKTAQTITKEILIGLWTTAEIHELFVPFLRECALQTDEDTEVISRCILLFNDYLIGTGSQIDDVRQTVMKDQNLRLVPNWDHPDTQEWFSTVVDTYRIGRRSGEDIVLYFRKMEGF